MPGFNQGVLLARLNSDIALTAFEGAVRNMVADVESTYWELYFAYRNLDTAVEGRDDSLRTWQKGAFQIRDRRKAATRRTSRRPSNNTGASR